MDEITKMLEAPCVILLSVQDEVVPELVHDFAGHERTKSRRGGGGVDEEVEGNPSKEVQANVLGLCRCDVQFRD